MIVVVRDDREVVMGVGAMIMLAYSVCVEVNDGTTQGAVLAAVSLMEW